MSLILGESVKYYDYYCKTIEIDNRAGMVKIQFLTGSKKGETIWVHQYDVKPVVQGNGK